MQEKSKLFVDGSVNPQKAVGYGAYLYCDDISLCTSQNVVTKRFENTSSTKLEIETLIWAVKDLSLESSFIVYTDCQNILSLLQRKQKLESSNYTTKTGKSIKNKSLYKEFFDLYEKYDFEIVKVKGHKKSSTKDSIDSTFSFVDKVSRLRLRQEF